MKTKLLLVAVAAASAFVLLGGVGASANPATGFTPTPLAKGNLAQPVEISARGIDFSTESSTDVYIQKATFAAFGNTGWHQHPGLVVVNVKSGTLIHHTGCLATVVHTGESFVETPLTTGMVENPHPETAEVFFTIIVPKDSPARIEAVAPNCSSEGSD